MMARFSVQLFRGRFSQEERGVEARPNGIKRDRPEGKKKKPVHDGQTDRVRRKRRRDYVGV